MIVDNSEEFRMALDSVLSDAYEIYHCSNGRQALEAALKINPDVIILDLMLTELDGVTLLHEIRSAGLRPMVLAVTRFFNDYVQETAQELGIGDHVIFTGMVEPRRRIPTGAGPEQAAECQAGQAGEPRRLCHRADQNADVLPPA